MYTLTKDIRPRLTPATSAGTNHAGLYRAAHDPIATVATADPPSVLHHAVRTQPECSAAGDRAMARGSSW